MTLTEAAQQLQDSGEYRVLRRVPPIREWPLQPSRGPEITVRACIVDTETTGLSDTDEVCELAILPFDYDKETGGVVAVHVDQALGKFCQPSIPIPAEATRVHHITDEMVAGLSISDAEVAAAVGDAKLLLAHSARFDRGKVAKQWPLLDTIPWGCTWEDIDWRSGGYESGKLAYLLMCMGYFYEGHRAMHDCIATLFALTQPLGESTALFALLQGLRKPLYKVQLFNTPYSSKDAIKARGGYRWDDKHRDGKNWWKVTSEPADESQWFDSELGGVDDDAYERAGFPSRHSYPTRLASGHCSTVRMPALFRHSDAKVESL